MLSILVESLQKKRDNGIGLLFWMIGGGELVDDGSVHGTENSPLLAPELGMIFFQW